MGRLSELIVWGGCRAMQICSRLVQELIKDCLQFGMLTAMSYRQAMAGRGVQRSKPLPKV